MAEHDFQHVPERVAEIELAHVKERQAIGIALAKKRGVFTGRKPGTTKADPSRARD
jgi:DNA invertase Pin-like site-specific DNA recombinase